MKKIIASMLIASLFTFNFNVPCFADYSKNTQETPISTSVAHDEKQLEQSIVNTLFKLSHNKDLINILINNYNKSYSKDKSFLNKVKKWSSSGIGWILKKVCSIIMKVLGFCISMAACAFIVTYMCKKFITTSSAFKLLDSYMRVFNNDKS